MGTVGTVETVETVETVGKVGTVDFPRAYICSYLFATTFLCHGCLTLATRLRLVRFELQTLNSLASVADDGSTRPNQMVVWRDSFPYPHQSPGKGSPKGSWKLFRRAYQNHAIAPSAPFTLISNSAADLTTDRDRKHFDRRSKEQHCQVHR